MDGGCPNRRDLAPRRRQQPEQHPDQRRLARPVGAEQADYLAWCRPADQRIAATARWPNARVAPTCSARAAGHGRPCQSSRASAATITASCRSGLACAPPSVHAAAGRIGPSGSRRPGSTPSGRPGRATPASPPRCRHVTARPLGTDPDRSRHRRDDLVGVPGAQRARRRRARARGGALGLVQIGGGRTAPPRRPPPRCAISHHRSARLTGSTPVVGSSSTSRAGPGSMARDDAELLPHAAGQVARQASAARRRGRCGRGAPPPVPAPAARARRSPRPRKLEVLLDDQVRVDARRWATGTRPPVRGRGGPRRWSGGRRPGQRMRSSVVLPAPSPPTTR